MNSIYLALLIKSLLLLISSCGSQVILPHQLEIKVLKISSTGETFAEIPSNLTEHLVLHMEVGRVELVCNANLPIKWEYIYKGKSLPNLEVRYKRILRNVGGSLQEFKEPAKNGFEGRVTLRGILESQTGKYVCRYYNGRLTNNSYQASAHLNIFVPGNRTFNEVTHVKFINRTDPSVLIPCPVTDPKIHVRLFKLNENFYNKTRELKWKSIYTDYNPLEGFHLQGGLGRDLLGDYNCSTGNGTSIRLLVADLSTKSDYEAHLTRLKSCWETETFIRLARSKRLECFCKDSYGLFVNEGNFEEENRRGNCESLDTWLSILEQNCSDWRLEEFFRNGEESTDLCFRDEIRDMFNGTGTRFILRAMSKQTSSLNPWLRNLTVLYDGLPNWASGIKIGLGRVANGTSWVEMIDKEPTQTQLYPLAHYKAVWADLVIDIREVRKVHVFQPDSFSFEWFEVSKVIPVESFNPEISNESSTSNASSCNNILLSLVWGVIFLVFGMEVQGRLID